MELAERFAKAKAKLIDDTVDFMARTGNDELSQKKLGVIDNIFYNSETGIRYKNRVYCGCICDFFTDKEIESIINTIAVIFTYNENIG